MKPLVPVFIVVALAFPLFAGADVVFQNSFESPSVKIRTPKAAGGDISKADPAHPEEKPFWLSFGDQPNIGATGGSIIAGVTNEVARTGNQSLFIEASKLSAPYIGASFSTRPLPIAGGKYYKISLWGRNDAKKPLIRAAAQLFLKMQIDFFTDEGKTETGDTQYLLQPLPGGKGYASTFVPTSWQPVGLHFGAPPKAKFMVLSFRCDSSAERGAISGTAYFDDFTVFTDQRQPSDALLEQLLQEGVIQVFYLRDSDQKIPLLAAVGPLQFEVVQYRLESEYGATSRLESVPWEIVKWLKADTTPAVLKDLKLPTGCRIAYDADEQPVVLFPSQWTMTYFIKQNPDATLFDLSADSKE